MAKQETAPRLSPRFGLRSLWFGLAGLAALAAGYLLLDAGSVTVAPLLIAAGYVVLFPLAILK